MKNTIVLLFIGLVIVLLGNVRAECIKTQVIEDISLPGQKAAEGHRNMMAIPEALETFCSLNPIPSQLFSTALNRLNDQRDLIPLLVADGELKPNQVRYYKAFFDEIEDNLIECESEAINMRSQGRVPSPEKLVDLTIRPNDIIDVIYLSKVGGSPVRHLVSHKVWYGRIIEYDGYDLCQTSLR